MTEEQPPAGAYAPPLPPPDPGGWNGLRDDGRFDLGGLLSFAFKDPKALSKFLIGSVMVLLIPILGFGLIALLGYGVQTARRALGKERHPLADWDDFGSVLLDGFRAAGVFLVYVGGLLIGSGLIVGAIVLTGWLLGMAIHSGAAVAIPSSPPLIALLIMLGVILFVVAVAVKFVLTPLGLLRVAATGRFGDAFAIRDNLAVVRSHVGTWLFLLVALLLFHILSDLTILLCIIGIIPGTFWWFAVAGAAIGHTGALMKVESS